MKQSLTCKTCNTVCRSLPYMNKHLCTSKHRHNLFMNTIKNIHADVYDLFYKKTRKYMVFHRHCKHKNMTPYSEVLKVLRLLETCPYVLTYELDGQEIDVKTLYNLTDYPEHTYKIGIRKHQTCVPKKRLHCRRYHSLLERGLFTEEDVNLDDSHTVSISDFKTNFNKIKKCDIMQGNNLVIADDWLNIIQLRLNQCVPYERKLYDQSIDIFLNLENRII